jgi:hypothetical protein
MSNICGVVPEACLMHFISDGVTWHVILMHWRVHLFLHSELILYTISN